MALTHLLDTSVVSRLGAPMVKAVVEPLVNEGRLGRAGITDLEVGYGSRNAREWDQDLVNLPIFELVETTAEHIRRARQVQRLLALLTQSTRSQGS
ncbi:MAG TPA: hypothetical protein VFC03_09780 [Acidimicrobiales bacterium]|nr:hypothetical protein [Acidimicrobiales bacterium]